MMLKNVAPHSDSKSRNYLKILASSELSEIEIQEKLDMNPGALYTLKSRLTTKVVHYYTNLRDNKIRLLREEAARVPTIVFSNEKLIAISFLKDLEKKLREYDLSSELALVYKQLARLHRFENSYAHYESLYQRHIAYSLAVSKAEDLMYEYIFNLGYYHLTKLQVEETYAERLEDLLDELENTFSLYESHRLFTIYHIVKWYHECTFLNREDLALQEIEFERTMAQIDQNLERYSLDPFYTMIRSLKPFLFFEYYVRINNKAKAKFYLDEIYEQSSNQLKAHLWSFFVSQFLLSLMRKLNQDHDLEVFLHFSDKFKSGNFLEDNELSHLVSFYRYKSLTEFYRENYSKAALVLNELRQVARFKEFPSLDIELKLFQAWMYVIQGETDLYLKMVQSAKRQAKTDERLRISVKSIAKVLFILNKSHYEKVKDEQLFIYLHHSQSPEGNPAKLFNYLYTTDESMRRFLK